MEKTDKLVRHINVFSLNTLDTEGGVFLIDKPLNWTSFDVVNKLRFRLVKILGQKKLKVGHAGTLDPLATGLVIVCVGKMTKEIDSFMGLPKSYTGTIKLGATTPSYDAETEENAVFPIEHIDAAVLEQARHPFLGDIAQMPPQFSAIKKDGKPLYESARKGIEVAVEPRKVHISRFDVTRTSENSVDFAVDCSKGTYIRSLAYDFGKACNSGGYLTALRRTKIGDYAVTEAWDLDQLIRELDKNIMS